MLTFSSKSQLAIEYCYRVKETSPDCWIFWIHASSPERLDIGIREIADALQLLGRQNANVDMLRLVELWLRGSGKQWLLILDNADLEDVLFKPANAGNPALPNASKKRTIDYLAPPSCGMTILTTRHKKVASKFVDHFDIVTVGPMIKTDAIALFENKAGKHHDATNIERFVNELGYVPLAIAHAAAFIKRKVPSCTVHTYLGELRKTIVSDKSLLTANYDELRRDSEAYNSVISTWQVSFEHIRQERPSAADRLSLMSFYDHRSIPKSLLCMPESPNSPLPRGELAGRYSPADVDLDEDILMLYEFHLINISVGSEELELHPLVQLAARKWLQSRNEEDQWLRKSIQYLKYALPDGADRYSPQWGIFLPHIQLVLTHELHDEVSALLLSDICYRMHLYVASQDVQASQVCLRRCLAERTRHLGTDHISTLRTQFKLIQLLMLFRIEEKEAQTMLKHCSTMAETNCDLNLDWRDLHAACLQLKGTVEASQGHFVNAETHLRTAVGLYDEHSTYKYLPECIESLKRVLLRQQKQSEAEVMCRQALETCMKYYGSEHKSTLQVTASLANVLYETGNLAESLKLRNSVFEAYKKHIYGVDHFSTLWSMTNVADILYAQKKTQEALDLTEQAYRMCGDRYGDESIIALTHAEKHAYMLGAAGRLSQAIEMMRACVTIIQRIYGSEHPYTIEDMRMVAEWEHELRVAHKAQTAQRAPDAQEERDEPKRQGRRRKRDQCVIQ
jgi:tetratricopeptide (TPR) repeat protein